MKSYIKTFETFEPKRLVEREVELAAMKKILAEKILDVKKTFKENPSQIYVLTEELNGENQIIPSDYDFDSGTEFFIKKIKKDVIIVYEPEGDYDADLWAFDLGEFVHNSKKKN